MSASLPTPTEMLALLYAALQKNAGGISKIRFSDGRTIEYASRAELVSEIQFWEGKLALQQTGGIVMGRMSFKGDA